MSALRVSIAVFIFGVLSASVAIGAEAGWTAGLGFCGGLAIIVGVVGMIAGALE